LATGGLPLGVGVSVIGVWHYTVTYADSPDTFLLATLLDDLLQRNPCVQLLRSYLHLQTYKSRKELTWYSETTWGELQAVDKAPMSVTEPLIQAAVHTIDAGH
jgi:hypothetical protein